MYTQRSGGAYIPSNYHGNALYFESPAKDEDDGCGETDALSHNCCGEGVRLREDTNGICSDHSVDHVGAASEPCEKKREASILDRFLGTDGTRLIPLLLLALFFFSEENKRDDGTLLLLLLVLLL